MAASVLIIIFGLYAAINGSIFLFKLALLYREKKAKQKAWKRLVQVLNK